MADIFRIFPEEIWEEILERMEDSEDILNMVEAYPELKILCRGKEYAWLIGDILPLIIPKYLYLDWDDFLDYRLVSKRWNNAISNILETHPDRLPYKSCKLKKITDNHFNYHKLPNISTNLATFVYKNFRGGSIIKNGSPFPGGKVTINVRTSVDEADPRYSFPIDDSHVLPSNVELRKAFPLLQIYGHHIISLHIKFDTVAQLDSEIINDKIEYPWFQCLSCLPNLKSLKVTGLLEYTSENIFGERRKQLLEFISKATYPFQLDTLDLSDYHPVTEYADINHSFILSLGSYNQIKKLVILADLWKSEYANLFQNVCDLQVRMSVCEIHESSELEKILKDLQCSPIRKLKISTCFASIRDILAMLAEYKIEFLEIAGEIVETPPKAKDVEGKESFSCRFKKSFTSLFGTNSAPNRCIDNQNRDKAILIVPSIKYLRLTMDNGSYICFHFLNTLPSLTYLTIDTGRHLSGWEDMYSVRGSLLNIYFKSKPDSKYVVTVWKDFLEFANIIVRQTSCSRHYVRESENAIIHCRVLRYF